MSMHKPLTLALLAAGVSCNALAAAPAGDAAPAPQGATAARQALVCGVHRDDVRASALAPANKPLKLNCARPKAGMWKLDEIYADGWSLREVVDPFRPGGMNDWDSFLFILEK